MAQSTGADYIIIHPEERIEFKIISMFKKLNMGAVEDIKIDFGFKDSEIEAVPKVQSIFSGNSCQIFARIYSKERKKPDNADSKKGPVYARYETTGKVKDEKSYGIPETVPERILVTGNFKGRDMSWSLPVAIAGGNGAVGRI